MLHSHYAELACHLALTELWNECMTSSLGNSAATRGKTGSIARGSWAINEQSSYTLHINEPFFRLKFFSLVWGARQLLRGLRVWWEAWVQNEVSEIETDLESYKLTLVSAWLQKRPGGVEKAIIEVGVDPSMPELFKFPPSPRLMKLFLLSYFANFCEQLQKSCWVSKTTQTVWMVMLWQD